MGGDVKEDVVYINVDLREKRIKIFAVVSVRNTNLVIVLETHDVSISVVGCGNHGHCKILIHIDG